MRPTLELDSSDDSPDSEVVLGSLDELDFLDFLFFLLLRLFLSFFDLRLSLLRFPDFFGLSSSLSLPSALSMAEKKLLTTVSSMSSSVVLSQQRNKSKALGVLLLMDDSMLPGSSVVRRVRILLNLVRQIGVLTLCPDDLVCLLFTVLLHQLLPGEKSADPMLAAGICLCQIQGKL